MILRKFLEFAYFWILSIFLIWQRTWKLESYKISLVKGKMERIPKMDLVTFKHPTMKRKWRLGTYGEAPATRKFHILKTDANFHEPVKFYPVIDFRKHLKIIKSVSILSTKVILIFKIFKCWVADHFLITSKHLSHIRPAPSDNTNPCLKKVKVYHNEETCNLACCNLICRYLKEWKLKQAVAKNKLICRQQQIAVQF